MNKDQNVCITIVRAISHQAKSTVKCDYGLTRELLSSDRNGFRTVYLITSQNAISTRGEWIGFGI